jgi:hypothetical protein
VELRKLHIEELHNWTIYQYYCDNRIKEDETDGICSIHGCVYKRSVGKYEGRRPHGRPRYKYKEHIKVHVKEIRCEDLDWIHLSEDSSYLREDNFFNTITNIQVSSKVRNFLTS